MLLRRTISTLLIVCCLLSLLTACGTKQEPTIHLDKPVPHSTSTPSNSTNADEETSSPSSITPNETKPVEPSVTEPTEIEPTNLESWQLSKCSMQDMSMMSLYEDYFWLTMEIFENIKARKTKETVDPMNMIWGSDDINKACTTVLLTHFAIFSQCKFWVFTNGTAIIIPNEEGYQHLDEILSWADQVIQDLRINQDTTEYEAIEKINDFLCDYLVYDHDTLSNDVYRAIKEKTCVCLSYSALFQLLCHKCGIRCGVDANYSINHAYNYVIFSDESETCKYIDVTWNDASKVGRYKYFLLNEDEFNELHGLEPPIYFQPEVTIIIN